MNIKYKSKYKNTSLGGQFMFWYDDFLAVGIAVPSVCLFVGLSVPFRLCRKYTAKVSTTIFFQISLDCHTSDHTGMVRFFEGSRRATRDIVEPAGHVHRFWLRWPFHLAATSSLDRRSVGCGPRLDRLVPVRPYSADLIQWSTLSGVWELTNVQHLSVRPSICLLSMFWTQRFENEWTNFPCTSGPWGKGMERSTLGVRRSKVKFTGGPS